MPGPPMSRRFAAQSRARVGGPLRSKEERRNYKGAYSKSIRYVLKLIWSVRPAYVVLNLLNTLWNIPTKIFDVYIIQFVVNTATSSGDLMSIALMVAAYLAFMLVQYACTSYVQRNYNLAAEDAIRSDIQQQLREQARSIDLAYFDTKEFYDDYARALDVLDERVIKCWNDLVSVLGSIVSIVTLASLMASMSPALIVIIAAGCICSSLAYSRRSRIAVMRNQAVIPLLRRFQYLNDLYYKRQYAKDIRTERIDEIAQTDHRDTTEALVAEDGRWGAKSALMQFLGSGSNAVSDAAMYLYLAWGVIAGQLNAGNFMALWNAASQFSSGIRMLFVALPELGETCLLIQDVRGFDSQRSTISDPAPQQRADLERIDTLTVTDMSFAYEQETYVLRDVSFELKRGQTLAIVGHNGAGKSTLAKLLLRLYDPDSGQITVNGTSLKDYQLDDLHEHVAVMHQDYQLYAYSVAQNVLMRTPESEADIALVRDALDKVGLLEKVDGFAQGIDTHVTKEFSDEGALFSGGELQRLAIARAIAKDADLLIMDEPSSALDPIAEREVIDLLAQLEDQRMSIIISHRLSMTRDADCILVMDNGQIVESGTHTELLRKDGHYAKLWNAQADKYTSD